jgi:hypothetical protein
MLCGALCPLIALALQVAAPPASEQSVTFPFDDAALLEPGQHDGGLAFVPAVVPTRAPVPLVVFLHGNNEARALHPRLRDGDDDLRVLARRLAGRKVAPFVVAAPSHTRGADAAELLFPAFDLDRFVAATEGALAGRARVDRARIVVVGHSGGACNPTGGLVRAAVSPGAVRPMAYVASDGCMGSYVSDALENAAKTAKVRVFWQTWMWPRATDAFGKSFCAPRADARDVACQVLELTGPDAHERALVVGLDAVLPELLR